MRRAGRNLLAIILMFLGSSLFFVSALETSTNIISHENMALQRLSEDPALSPAAVILFGAGLLNFAFWGRKKCRTGSPESNDPG